MTSFDKTLIDAVFYYFVSKFHRAVSWDIAHGNCSEEKKAFLHPDHRNIDIDIINLIPKKYLHNEVFIPWQLIYIGLKKESDVSPHCLYCFLFKSVKTNS